MSKVLYTITKVRIVNEENSNVDDLNDLVGTKGYIEEGVYGSKFAFTIIEPKRGYYVSIDNVIGFNEEEVPIKPSLPETKIKELVIKTMGVWYNLRPFVSLL